MENTCRKKLFRVTTADISLDGLLKGQLKYLNQYFEVVGVAKDTGVLEEVGKREGIRVIDAPLERPISLIKDIRALWFLYRLFRKEKPWCVHANTPKGSLLSMIAAYFARVPHRIYTVTGLRYQGSYGILRQILSSMEIITCKFANKIIPEGKGIKETLQKDGITNKELNVILNGNINGIDTDFFNPELFNYRNRIEGELYTGNRNDIRNDLGLKDDEFVFIFIGRIVRDKGINEIVSCMKRFKNEKRNVKLLLVGRFETELDPLDFGNEEFLRTDTNVLFVGYQNDVRPFFIAADVLVFPSYREGFPNVVLQAGAMGLPAIVTDINGCNEIIQENVNGKIFSPRNAEALYEAMNWCLDNKETVKNMASCSRKIIIDRYQQKAVWEATLQEYRKFKK